MIDDCYMCNDGSELYRIVAMNQDGTLDVEYILVAEDRCEKQVFHQVPSEIVSGLRTVPCEHFMKVSDAIDNVITVAKEITKIYKDIEL